MQHQKRANQASQDLSRRDLSTDELAALLHVQAQTVRASLCRKGHYCGIRPRKLPNRLLVWPRDAVERLLEGEAA
jgi:hypothetical protein